MKRPELAIRMAVGRALTLVAEKLIKGSWEAANRLGSEEVVRGLEPRYAEVQRKLNEAKARLESNR
jgi:hypothetical protein